MISAPNLWILPILAIFGQNRDYKSRIIFLTAEWILKLSTEGK